jgi:hypothetical protein
VPLVHIIPWENPHVCETQVNTVSVIGKTAASFENCYTSVQASHFRFPEASAARSNSVTRTSTSSISMALAAWSKTLSAALTRVECGALASNMIFSSVFQV